MSPSATAKTVQYLIEGHADEQAWSTTLAHHIARVPAGSYRILGASAPRVRPPPRAGSRAVSEISTGVRAGSGRPSLRSPDLWGYRVPVSSLPLQLDWGRGSLEETMVKNVEAETSQLQQMVATYDAVGHFARAVDDDATSLLAQSISDGKRKGLEDLLGKLAGLVATVVRAQIERKSNYDPSTTGAAQSRRLGHESTGVSAAGGDLGEARAGVVAPDTPERLPPSRTEVSHLSRRLARRFRSEPEPIGGRTVWASIITGVHGRRRTCGQGFDDAAERTPLGAWPGPSTIWLAGTA